MMKAWMNLKYRFTSKIFLIFFLVLSLLGASCKDTQNNTPHGQVPGEGKVFEVKKISLWGEKASGKSFLNFSRTSVNKILIVQVNNCQNFDVKYSIGKKNGKGIGIRGTATVEDVVLPDGKNELKISLTAEGMKEYTYTCIINYRLQDPKVNVFLKKKEDANPFIVGKRAEYLTNENEADLEVKTETEMKKAIVADKEIELSADKKSFSTKVGLGEIEVKVFFENLNDFAITFKLKKNESGELPMNLSSAKLYSGNALQRENEGDAKEYDIFFHFDENGVMRDNLEVTNVEYSIVRLEMEFDVPIQEARITKCEDTRSENYATDPTSEDYEGIFSGRIAAKADPNNPAKEIPLSNIDPNNPNKYTELLILGGRTVSYTINFKAAGRKDATYTIKMNNVLEAKMEKPTITGAVALNGYTSSGLYGRWPSWRWFGYTKQPVSAPKGSTEKQKQQYRKDGQKQPEYMGDIVRMTFSMKNDYLRKGTMMFLYHRFDNREAEGSHDFVLTEGVENTELHRKVVYANFDPQEKHVDAFVSFKNLLPWGVLPYSLQRPWEKVVDKGLLLKITRTEVITNSFVDGDGKTQTDKQKAREKFRNIFDYRIQTKTFGHEDENKRVLKMNYKQKYKDFSTGAVHTLNFGPLTGDVSSGEKRDIFVMQPLCALEDITSLKYEIRREGSNGNAVEDYKMHEYKAMPSGSEAFIIGGDDTTVYTDKTPTVTNYDNIFKFKKLDDSTNMANKYNIDVTMTKKDGGTQVFKMLVDYSETESETLEQMSYGMDGGCGALEDETFFGLPFHYSDFVSLSNL